MATLVPHHMAGDGPPDEAEARRFARRIATPALVAEGCLLQAEIDAHFDTVAGIFRRYAAFTAAVADREDEVASPKAYGVLRGLDDTMTYATIMRAEQIGRQATNADALWRRVAELLAATEIVDAVELGLEEGR